MTGAWQRVALEDIAVEMSVGVLERERERPQRLLVDVEMWRRRWPGARSLGDCLDYDRVFAHVTGTWPGRAHVDLLETLVDELLAFCLEDDRIDWCRVRLRKPDIYAGRATPLVEAARGRAAPPAAPS